LDDETNFYTEAAGFAANDRVDPTTGTAIGALAGYKLDDSGKIVDVTFIGNANAQVNGNDKYSKPVGQVSAFDDDTYKITVDGTKYLLTDDTKIFLYTAAALGLSNDTARDNSKVVTASELAGFDTPANGNAPYTVYAAAVVMAGSSNSSTVEAIALYADNNYFKASAGDQYPALITGITQTIVSGSSSKYDYTITAFINGEEQTLKTEQQTNSNFVTDVLTTNNGGVKFKSANDAKNKFAWITVNGEGIVTKIVPVSEDAPNEAIDDSWTSTRAIVVGKTSKGITYIPNDDWTLTNGEVATADGSDFDVAYKTTTSNFAAFAKDSYIYSLDVRPAYAAITNSVKEKALDNDYECSVGALADVQVSTITDSITTNVYYVADLFFDDDGDIMAVFTYEKDLTNAKQTVKLETNTAKVSSTTAVVGDTVTVTGAAANSTYTGDCTVAADGSVTVNTDTAGTKTVTVKADGYNDQTLTVVVTATAVPDVKDVQAYAWVGGENVQLCFLNGVSWLSKTGISEYLKANNVAASDIKLTLTDALGSSRTLNITSSAVRDYEAPTTNPDAFQTQLQTDGAGFLKLFTGEENDLEGTLNIKIEKLGIDVTFDVPGTSTIK
jgi:hypothetical protein